MIIIIVKEALKEMSKVFSNVNHNPQYPPLSNGKGICIKRDCYTMAMDNNQDAEITMYGEIVEKRPRDWWTGEPIEGMYIALDQFLEDLKELKNVKNLTIRMNSVGGDAVASITIHNRLKDLKTNITCIVDGVAMSGGSLIMCAANTVKVNPSSLIMIHKCWEFLFGAYNSTDLHKVLESNNTVDKAQAAIYRSKTGLTEEEILELMEKETYMTGEEAVKKGFADELINGEELNIAASANRSKLFINGRMMPLHYSRLPKNFPTIVTDKLTAVGHKSTKVNGESAMINTISTSYTPAEAEKKEGGINMKTIEELKAEHPDVIKQFEEEVKASAIEAERKRQQEIDEIASAVNDNQLVKEAKYGPNACTAQELAFRAMQKQAKLSVNFLSDMNADYQSSKAAKVQATPNSGDDNNTDIKDKINATVDAGINAVKKAFGSIN